MNIDIYDEIMTKAGNGAITDGMRFSV